MLSRCSTFLSLSSMGVASLPCMQDTAVEVHPRHINATKIAANGVSAGAPAPAAKEAADAALLEHPRVYKDHIDGYHVLVDIMLLVPVRFMVVRTICFVAQLRRICLMCVAVFFASSASATSNASRGYELVDMRVCSACSAVQINFMCVRIGNTGVHHWNLCHLSVLHTAFPHLAKGCTFQSNPVQCGSRLSVMCTDMYTVLSCVGVRSSVHACGPWSAHLAVQFISV